MSKNSYQLFAEDCFTILAKIIDKISTDYSKKYDLINNDKETFEFEFTVLIFYLTMQKFANIFNDKQKEDEILDNLHSTFYASLKNQRNISDVDLEKICSTLNERYKGYK